MHELTRRAYLEAIGVDSYTSRGQLPGAAATQRLVIVPRSPAPLVGDSSQVGSATTAAVSNTAVAFLEAANVVKGKLGASRASSGTEPAKPTATTPTAVVPSFSIVAVTAGGYLWLEELSQPAVSRGQVQLIRAMVKALALPEGEWDVSQFDWPIHNNAQLDLGAEAANAALGGFIQRKADRCRGAIFLGDACQQKLDMTQLSFGKTVSTVSTLEMLQYPRLKKQAWQNLLALAIHP